MSRRSLVATIVVTAVVTALVTVSMTRAVVGQGTRPARTADGKPNLSGVWQVNNERMWELQPHAARPGAVTQRGMYPYAYAEVPAAPVLALGAAAIVPGSLGVVQGDGQIPYTPAAAMKKPENGANWIDRDPELKCYLPGVPRATYMPYPFQIVQSPTKIQMIYTFSNAARTTPLDKVAKPPADTWMGHSVGRWDGDTLVVDVTDFNDKTCFDRAGNYHSDALRVVERFSLKTPDVIWYEATITDPNVFSAPWTIAMPLYPRMDANAQLTEYQCIDMVEEFLYGNLRKKPAVSHWESDTITIDVKRKIPPGDKFYEWFRR